MKARLVRKGDKRSQTFSAFRSWDFDAALFLLFDAENYDLAWAREVSRAETEALGRRVEHTNSYAVLVRQVRTAGVDVTQRLETAFASIDVPTGSDSDRDQD